LAAYCLLYPFKATSNRGKAAKGSRTGVEVQYDHPLRTRGKRTLIPLTRIVVEQEKIPSSPASIIASLTIANG
jgi:hypothetical protein